jgi:hypothetical protein
MRLYVMNLFGEYPVKSYLLFIWSGSNELIQTKLKLAQQFTVLTQNTKLHSNQIVVSMQHAYTGEMIRPSTEGVGLGVMLWTPFPEVFVSNLGRNTGCPDWPCSWFPPARPEKFWDSISIRPLPLPSKSFPVRHLSIIVPFDKLECRYWRRRSVNHNKRRKLLKYDFAAKS